jgi:uncharacterized protein (DUF2062 family)
MASFRSLLSQVLHLQESPERTAFAFAIGAAIAFCPFYGFHTILVVFTTWALRLNFIAIMAGNLLNNPWTTVPVLGLTYWTGALLLGRTDSPAFDWNDLSFRAIYDQVLPYAAPFLLGGIVLSILAAVISYPLAYYLIYRYRRRSSPVLSASLPPRDPLG